MFIKYAVKHNTNNTTEHYYWYNKQPRFTTGYIYSFHHPTLTYSHKYPALLYTAMDSSIDFSTWVVLQPVHIDTCWQEIYLKWSWPLVDLSTPRGQTGSGIEVQCNRCSLRFLNPNRPNSSLIVYTVDWFWI